MFPHFYPRFPSAHLVAAPHLSFSALLHHTLVLPICFLLAVHTSACCPQGLAESPSAFKDSSFYTRQRAIKPNSIKWHLGG